MTLFLHEPSRTSETGKIMVIPDVQQLRSVFNTDPGATKMKINGVECSFHHLGIPTLDKKQGERYSQVFDMY
jgi:hypothetical protein